MVGCPLASSRECSSNRRRTRKGWMWARHVVWTSRGLGRERANSGDSITGGCGAHRVQNAYGPVAQVLVVQRCEEYRVELAQGVVAGVVQRGKAHEDPLEQKHLLRGHEAEQLAAHGAHRVAGHRFPGKHGPQNAHGERAVQGASGHRLERLPRAAADRAP